MTPLWPDSIPEAKRIQLTLANQVERADRFDAIRSVAGLDIGFPRGSRRGRVAVVRLSFPELGLLEQVVLQREVTFPYVPGLLSFRETPLVLEALDGLTEKPDLLLCDGQGVAHPRRFGLACHLGLLSDRPSIGVAKSRLIGQPAAELPAHKGAWVPLLDNGEIVGALLRSRDRVAPLYISSGHRVGLESAIRLVLACTKGFRLPETSRMAHHLASVATP
ncbi:MAG: deoxyribonuclease V [Magnetococcales bacterium]|nr:deoxyribonuclease V [Magnetococcales bacterium]